ncbi:CBS domain-containing protein [Bowmanella pacifica]|uniref:CBS domain-containing protein n=1 Tax=Bowmanella pacifica TaxID=502051 RepID=A0A917YXY3_9ALTE|nr:CBS domain-containing protein [Bowmanella pacifica]GGO70012.1 hypothetical protein GCM10010982_22510 [Bowmanella pacifica]
MRIGDLPLRTVIRYVKTTDTLETARQQMLKTNVSSLLVVDSQAAPKAILTSRDMLKVSSTEHVPIASLASRPLLTLSEDADMRQACSLMLEHGCHHVVVVRNEDVVGVLSSLDIVAYYLSL